MNCPNCGEELRLPLVERLVRWHNLVKRMEADPRTVPLEDLSMAFDDLEKEIDIYRRDQNEAE